MIENLLGRGKVGKAFRIAGTAVALTAMGVPVFEGCSSSKPKVSTPNFMLKDHCARSPYEVYKVNNQFSLEAVICGNQHAVALVRNDNDGKPTQDGLGATFSQPNTDDIAEAWDNFKDPQQPGLGVAYRLTNGHITNVHESLSDSNG